MTAGPRGPTEGRDQAGPPAPDPLTRERMADIARILDEPQLKRLGGVILALSLDYVYASQQAPAAIRQLLAGAAVPAPLPVGSDTLAMLLHRAYALNGTWGSLEALAQYVTEQPEWITPVSPGAPAAARAGPA